jgi:hypothetical protein
MLPPARAVMVLSHGTGSPTSRAAAPMEATAVTVGASSCAPILR